MASYPTPKISGNHRAMVPMTAPPTIALAGGQILTASKKSSVR